jgi:5-methylcytosine-specific restriction endonuclease McrA
MSKVNYHDYMQSPAWDQKRRARLKRDGYQCQDCGISGIALDVHHTTYDRLGRERMSDLVSLCRYCHKARHGKATIIDRLRIAWNHLK